MEGKPVLLEDASNGAEKIKSDDSESNNGLEAKEKKSEEFSTIETSEEDNEGRHLEESRSPEEIDGETEEKITEADEYIDDEEDDVEVHKDEEISDKSATADSSNPRIPDSNRNDWKAIIKDHLNRCAPPEREISMRQRIIHDARHILCHENLDITSFGSHGNGFDVRGSDLDLTAYKGKITAKKLGKRKCIDLLFHLRAKLEKHARNWRKNNKRRKREGKKWQDSTGYFHSIKVIIARVPVINAIHNPTRLEVDIVAQNTVAIVNTDLLKTYASLHDTIPKLGRVIKLWAKSHRIGSAKDSFISSYGWILLMIFHLQRIKAIPSLQARHLIKEEKTVKINGHDCTFCKDGRKLTSFKAMAAKVLDDLDISDLLYGFFQRFSVLNWKDVSVSIRRGHLCDRPRGGEKRCIWIEDPFELKHNLGKGVSAHGLKVMQHSLLASCKMLASGPARSLIKPIPFHSKSILDEKKDDKKKKREKRQRPKEPTETKLKAKTKVQKGFEADRQKLVLFETLSSSFVEKIFEKAEEIEWVKFSLDDPRDVVENSGFFLELEKRLKNNQVHEAAKFLEYSDTASFLVDVIRYMGEDPQNNNNEKDYTRNEAKADNDGGVEGKFRGNLSQEKDEDPEHTEKIMQEIIVEEVVSEEFMQQIFNAASLIARYRRISPYELSRTSLKKLKDRNNLQVNGKIAAKQMGLQNGGRLFEIVLSILHKRQKNAAL